MQIGVSSVGTLRPETQERLKATELRQEKADTDVFSPWGATAGKVGSRITCLAASLLVVTDGYARDTFS